MSAAVPPAGLPPRAPSRSYPPHEASRLRRIRRYAVPQWMIEQATERRLAGDWRGACAAANVDIAFDLADVANTYSDAVAAALEDDLRHFAPDLLRWHLPRLDGGLTTIAPSQTIVLGRPGGAPDALRLYVETPHWMAHGPQRLRLHVGPIFRSVYESGYLDSDWPYCAIWRGIFQDWSFSRHLWDVRHADELRERCGGDKERAPFFHGDGTPRGAAELPTADPGRTDPVALTEWVTLLHERGEVEAAFAAVGIDVDTTPFDLSYNKERVDPLDVLARIPFSPARMEAEVRRLAAVVGKDRFWLPHRLQAAIRLETGGSETGLRVQVVEYQLGWNYRNADAVTAVVPEACWRRLPDLDLLRDGHPPERLHPLVREALFPNRITTGIATGVAEEPPGSELSAPVRIRCRGEWHEVSFRDGDLHIPHSAEEQRREDAMRAFGGATAGCFAARYAWASGTERLPKALRDLRGELFARVQHGDLPGVRGLLDAGVDPRARDARRRTLLHMLHLLDPADPKVRDDQQELAQRLRHLDHDGLLARLLAAGLDINGRDENQRTPLFDTICGGGSVALIRALLTAGARIDVIGEIHEEPMSLYRLIEWRGRDDLNFITERIEREYPELTEEE